MARETATKATVEHYQRPEVHKIIHRICYSGDFCMYVYRHPRNKLALPVNFVKGSIEGYSRKDGRLAQKRSRLRGRL